MIKTEELWNGVVKEGINNYNNRRDKPELETLFLIGSSKSVIKIYKHLFFFVSYLFSFLNKIFYAFNPNLFQGKTTLIHAFLDKDDEPNASLPVEYTYIRRTNKHMVFTNSYTLRS